MLFIQRNNVVRGEDSNLESERWGRPSSAQRWWFALFKSKPSNENNQSERKKQRVAPFTGGATSGVRNINRGKRIFYSKITVRNNRTRVQIVFSLHVYSTAEHEA